MLVELLVENYAVVERLRVRFHRGLNVLTGETGGGKSIVVDALGLLLGGRASADLVRTGEERARIAGIFEAPDSRAFRSLLEQAGVEIEDGELLIEREVLATGKSRAFLGSRPVAVSLLRDLAPHLADIHGQHEQQELFGWESQLAMLDAFAAAGELREQVAEAHRRRRACLRELEELERGEQERLRLADLWGFQRQEIEGAAPRAGEDAELEAQRRILLNVAKLEEGAAAAYESLYEAPAAALAQVRQSRRRLEELSRVDAHLEEIAAALDPAEVAVEEASHALRSYLGRLEADPARLDHVEARLAALEKLKRKYGATLEQVLAYLEEVRGKLAAAETSGERREALARERAALEEAYRAAAARLMACRREAARELIRRVKKELAAVAMAGTEFQVQFSEIEWSERGQDRVDFLVSPNVGEEARPLEKVASGGELSRLALALKTCLLGRGGATAAGKWARTLVFDEVDAGIGGAVADAVGRRLKRLAAHHQVLCVTHLAQIAGYADHHFLVEKREAKGRTVATVEHLDGEARTREIGRMLSGQMLTPEALRHAEQLLKMAAG